MKKRSLISVLAVFLSFILCTSASAGTHGHNAPKKEGILLVAFGSIEGSAQVSFENIGKKKNEAVILMGHGTPHPSNAFYAALMFQLQLVDPNIFPGTVEGYLEVGLIRYLILKNKIKKAYLMPFMSVAGDHAKNDMAGDEDDSWKSILTKAGIQ